MENNKANTRNKEEDKDILDILLDEENKEPITLFGDDGSQHTFEQIAIIPYGEKLYCILQPIDKIENVGDNEAIVFYVDEPEEGEAKLKVETSAEVAVAVFEEYYKMLDEENLKSKK